MLGLVERRSGNFLNQVCSLLEYDYPQGIKALLQATQEGEWEVRKEAAIVLLNACNGCRPDQLQKLIANGILSALCALMSAEEKGIRIIALDTIEACIERAEINNACIHHISVSGCVQRLKDFAIRPENKMIVRQKAASCLSVLHGAIERAGERGDDETKKKKEEEKATLVRRSNWFLLWFLNSRLLLFLSVVSGKGKINNIYLHIYICCC